MLDCTTSSTLKNEPEVNVVVTSEELLRCAVEMLQNPNCFLLIDATGGVVTNAGGVDGSNLFLYVLIAGVPLSENRNYYLVIGYFVCSNQHAVNISVLMGQLMGRLRQLMKGKFQAFRYVVFDNSAAIRSAMALQINGCETVKLMRLASRIICGQCTVAEVLEFVPFHTCMAHELKSDALFCQKYKVTGIGKLLALRVLSVMHSLTCPLHLQFLVNNYITVLSSLYMTPNVEKSLKCIGEMCEFNRRKLEKEDDIIASTYADVEDPTFVCFVFLVIFDFIST